MAKRAAVPHHRNILVSLDGDVLERKATVFRRKRVLFYPASSEQTVTIKFCKDVPFKDWNGRKTRTGKKGKPVRGTVDINAFGDYAYDPGCVPCIHRGNPKLIVTGGN